MFQLTSDCKKNISYNFTFRKYQKKHVFACFGFLHHDQNLDGRIKAYLVMPHKYTLIITAVGTNAWTAHIVASFEQKVPALIKIGTFHSRPIDSPAHRRDNYAKCSATHWCVIVPCRPHSTLLSVSLILNVHGNVLH